MSKTFIIIFKIINVYFFNSNQNKSNNISVYFSNGNLRKYFSFEYFCSRKRSNYKELLNNFKKTYIAYNFEHIIDFLCLYTLNLHNSLTLNKIMVYLRLYQQFQIDDKIKI